MARSLPWEDQARPLAGGPTAPSWPRAQSCSHAFAPPGPRAPSRPLASAGGFRVYWGHSLRLRCPEAVELELEPSRCPCRSRSFGKGSGLRVPGGDNGSRGARARTHSGPSGRPRDALPTDVHLPAPCPPGPARPAPRGPASARAPTQKPAPGRVPHRERQGPQDTSEGGMQTWDWPGPPAGAVHPTGSRGTGGAGGGQAPSEVSARETHRPGP